MVMTQTSGAYGWESAALGLNSKDKACPAYRVLPATHGTSTRCPTDEDTIARAEVFQYDRPARGPALAGTKLGRLQCTRAFS